MKTPRVAEYLLPVWAVVALVNDDFSGLEEADEKSLEAFLKRGSSEHKCFSILCPEEVEGFFCQSNSVNNLGDNCLIVNFYIGGAR